MRKSRPRLSSSHTVLPLGIKNRLQTELPALVALQAIGEPWFATEHRADLLAVALVVREMAPEGSMESRCAESLQQLCTGPITKTEKTAIALVLAECLPWLQVQQNVRVQRAIAKVAFNHSAMAA